MYTVYLMSSATLIITQHSRMLHCIKKSFRISFDGEIQDYPFGVLCIFSRQTSLVTGDVAVVLSTNFIYPPWKERLQIDNLQV